MKVNQKGFSALGILTLVGVLALFGFISLLVYNKLKNTSDTQKTPSQTSQQDQKQEASATVDPYEGWKELSNERWGFSLKYPADWKVNTTEENFKDSATKQLSVTSIGPGESLHDFMMIEVLDMTLADVESNQWFKDSNIFDPADPSREQITLGSYNGYKYKTYGQEDTAYYFYEVKGKVILFEDNFGTTYEATEAKLIRESFRIR